MTAEQGGEPARPAAANIGLLAIFAAFLRIGCTSFGGGMPGWIYRDLVQRRGWLDDSAFLSSLALGQTMPGSNGVKLAVLVGQRLRGPAGAAAAFFGLLSGPFAIILAVAAVYAGLSRHLILHRVLDGVAAATIGLTFATGINAALRSSDPQHANRLAALAITVATVLAVGFLRWPIIPVILCLAPIGTGLALARQRQR